MQGTEPQDWSALAWAWFRPGWCLAGLGAGAAIVFAVYHAGGWNPVPHDTWRFCLCDRVEEHVRNAGVQLPRSEAALLVAAALCALCAAASGLWPYSEDLPRERRLEFSHLGAACLRSLVLVLLGFATAGSLGLGAALHEAAVAQLGDCGIPALWPLAQVGLAAVCGLSLASGALEAVGGAKFVSYLTQILGGALLVVALVCVLLPPSFV